MIDYGSMKRTSPEPLREDVRPPKRSRLAHTSKPTDTFPSASYFMSQYPVTTSNYNETCPVELDTCDDMSIPGLLEDISLAAMDAEMSHEMKYGIESSDEGAPLAEETLPQICLGVLLITVTSRSHEDDGNSFIPVDLETFGNWVKVVIQNSGRYAGLIKSSSILQLLGDRTVQLCATLSSPRKSPSKIPSKPASMLSQDSGVRIVVISTCNEKLRVGRVLSNSAHFLQHPYVEECGDLDYSNPHFLLRPGAAMPKLQNMMGSWPSVTAVSGMLNEVHKNRITRIFDVASHDTTQGICPLTLTSPRLKSTLKLHQLKAIAVMVEREGASFEYCQFPSIWETTRYSERSKRYRNLVTGIYTECVAPSMGGLLADDMGLGKTLSTLGLICLSIDSEHHPQGSSQKTLVVTTKSTLPGWFFQVDQHIRPGQLRTAVYHGSSRDLVAKHFHEYDLILTSYETLRSECDVKGPLCEQQWYRVVLDEAHHVRNRKSQVFHAVCSLKSSFRWCLTGTPVQNSLDDFGSLLEFLGTPGLNTKAMFDKWIARPINEKKQEGFKRLQILVRATCLRRTKDSMSNTLDLPQRIEETESVVLHDNDRQLYDFFKERAAALALGTKVSELTTSNPKSSQNDSVLSLLNFLRLICNHGSDILPETALTIWNSRDRPMLDIDEDPLNDDRCAFAYSAKIIALLSKLISTHTITYDKYGRYHAPKSVVFSYWTKMLDLIQRALANFSFKTCRIDGSTSLEARSTTLKNFKDDPDCSVMLATIGSAGEGLDLTVANHVHLMEPHWNPMAEAQAVDRVYRIGQQREVTITRYIVSNSIETYIQWVQQQKMKLISRIIDTEEVTQAEIDMERWKQLRENLGCNS